MSKPPRKTADKAAGKTRPDWMGAETPSRPDRIDVDDTPANAVFKLVQGDPSAAGPWESELDGCDAVVNLVGHNIFADRWSPEVRRKIRDSRVYSTEHVVAAIGKAQNKPKVLVQASATRSSSDCPPAVSIWKLRIRLRCQPGCNALAHCESVGRLARTSTDDGVRWKT